MIEILEKRYCRGHGNNCALDFCFGFIRINTVFSVMYFISNKSIQILADKSNSVELKKFLTEPSFPNF